MIDFPAQHQIESAIDAVRRSHTNYGYRRKLPYRYDPRCVPKPKLIKRHCGGWLAISPKRARFLIGITADTEGHAEHLFWIEYRRWIEIADGPITIPHIPPLIPQMSDEL